ncbi:MAG: DNA-3-methyladenine glycosylase family protein [Candidatus Thorarchaeota archaeon]
MNELKVNHFDLKDTIECGQTFCWIKEGEGYINSDVGQVVYVEQDGNKLRYDSSSGKVDIRELFRLADPLPEIQKEIMIDKMMKDSISFAPGLRIIKDPFFPCLISFICSIRNNIPSIRRLTQSLREKYGSIYKFREKTYYGMPTPKQMSKATIKELDSLRLGWRKHFIKRTTESIISGEVTPEHLKELEYEEAHELLNSLHGVGDKVADCVCLFSLGFLEAFPIDVWIERVIQKQYGIFTATGNSYAKKSKAAREYFGSYAGYAQEYLYYFSRSTF